MLLSYFKKRYFENKTLIYILMFYSILCFITSIINFIDLNIRNGIMSLLFMSYSLLAFLFEKIFKLKLNSFVVFLVYTIALGGLFGTCFELYIIFPFFDTFLHFLAGFTFANVGFLLFEHYSEKVDNKRKFWTVIFASICFSLSVALVWEVFEYITTFFGLDMLEDTIIYNFDSYLLAGSHNSIVSVNDISETIIHYANGQILILKGYLDIGLIDTLHDIIICIIGNIIFLLSVKINPETQKVYKNL